MHSASMTYMRSHGITVFINVHTDDIINRLQAMKVDRIVSQGQGKSMSEILQYRQGFYEMAYDLRVIVERGETPEQICDKVVAALRRYGGRGGYVSTRGQQSSQRFCDATLQGLAQDGGLFVPSDPIPMLTQGELDVMTSLSYSERALRVLEKWIHPDDIHPSNLKVMIEDSYKAEMFNGYQSIFPVTSLDTGVFLQEMFNGPTASFKDAALQLMPKIFLHSIKQSGTTSR